MSERNDKFFDDFYFNILQKDIDRESLPAMCWDKQEVDRFCAETGLKDIYQVDDFVMWLFEAGHYQSDCLEDIHSYSGKLLEYCYFQPTWELLDKFKLEQQKQCDLVEAQALF